MPYSIGHEALFYWNLRYEYAPEYRCTSLP